MPKPFEISNPDNAPPIYDALTRYLSPRSDVYRCPADERVWKETATASSSRLGISYSYVVWDKLDALSREDKTNFPIMSDLSAATSTWQVDPPHPDGTANRPHKDGSVESYAVH